MKKLTGAAIALVALAGIAAAQDWDAQGKAWWAHVQYLADDARQGRGIGTQGFEDAAQYVEKQFAEAGLKPAGTNGFRQTVNFNVVQLDEEHSSLEIVKDGKAEAVTLGEEAFLGAPTTAAPVDAGAVFIGYGLAIPEAKIDDFAGVVLKGKIAVYVTGGPSNVPSAIKAHYQSGEERRKLFAKAGAVGVMVIPNPKAEEVPWSRVAGSRFSQKMELADAEKRSYAPKCAIVVNPKYADKFLAGSGHTFEEIVELLGTDKPLPHFPLAVKIRANTAVKKSQASSVNLAGLLPGSDSKLKQEFVVVSAHLDHLGVGEPVNGDAIYNGAMDDASGVASVIEIAKAMQRDGAKPKRSVLFLAVTAEEKGLLGSDYFAKHPTVSGPIVADINMDMYLPLFPLKYLEVQGLGESTLGDDIREVAKADGVEVQADKQPDHNRFIRSDQYSFIKRGVPSLAFKFGWLPGTPEEKLFNDWYAKRYHGPSDDLTQTVDPAAAAKFDDILKRLVVRVADESARPEWKTDSFFKRFAQ